MRAKLSNPTTCGALLVFAAVASVLLVSFDHPTPAPRRRLSGDSVREPCAPGTKRTFVAWKKAFECVATEGVVDFSSQAATQATSGASKKSKAAEANANPEKVKLGAAKAQTALRLKGSSLGGKDISTGAAPAAESPSHKHPADLEARSTRPHRAAATKRTLHLLMAAPPPHVPFPGLGHWRGRRTAGGLSPLT